MISRRTVFSGVCALFFSGPTPQLARVCMAPQNLWGQTRSLNHRTFCSLPQAPGSCNNPSRLQQNNLHLQRLLSHQKQTSEELNFASAEHNFPDICNDIARLAETRAASSGSARHACCPPPHRRRVLQVTPRATHACAAAYALARTRDSTDPSAVKTGPLATSRAQRCRSTAHPHPAAALQLARSSKTR